MGGGSCPRCLTPGMRVGKTGPGRGENRAARTVRRRLGRRRPCRGRAHPKPRYSRTSIARIAKAHWESPPHINHWSFPFLFLLQIDNVLYLHPINIFLSSTTNCNKKVTLPMLQSLRDTPHPCVVRRVHQFDFARWPQPRAERGARVPEGLALRGGPPGGAHPLPGARVPGPRLAQRLLRRAAGAVV